MSNTRNIASRKNQSRFIKEYLKDLNGKYAAIRAGYSPNGAEVQACNLLKRPDIKEKVEKELAERAIRTDITTDKVVLELAKVALANLQDIVGKDISKLSKEDAAALYKVTKSVTQTGTVKYTYVLQDKLKALELLMKHLGMININVKGKIEHEHNFNDLTDRDLTNELSAFLAGIDAARATRQTSSGNGNGQAKLPIVRNNGKKGLPAS